ncbi:MAG: DUF1361 domain-containing protein [Bacteroidota bacterium]
MLERLYIYAQTHPEFSYQVVFGISIALIVGLILSPFIRKWYYCKQQFFSMTIMMLSTLLCMVLLGMRLVYSEKLTFIFLVWNLFLAWIPFALALNLERITSWFNSRVITAFLLGSWLLFFPNAPYIITDLIHLKMRAPIPLWYDLMLIITFAWTGLMLGYLSLYEVQKFIRRRAGKRKSWIFSGFALLLCSFGIYLGRFLRFNSWDILFDPSGLLQQALDSVFQLHTIVVTGLITAFLVIGYFSMFMMVSEPARSSNNLPAN